MFTEGAVFSMVGFVEVFIVSQGFKYIEGLVLNIAFIVIGGIVFLGMPTFTFFGKTKFTGIKLRGEVIIWWFCFFLGLLVTSVVINQFSE